MVMTSWMIFYFVICTCSYLPSNLLRTLWRPLAAPQGALAPHFENRCASLHLIMSEDHCAVMQQ